MTGNWSDEETDNPHPTATPGKFLRVTRSCRYYRGQQNGYELGLTPIEHLNCDFGIALNDASACSHRFVFELASRFGGAKRARLLQTAVELSCCRSGRPVPSKPLPIVGTNNPYDVVLPDEGSTAIRLSYNGAVHITNNVTVWK